MMDRSSDVSVDEEVVEQVAAHVYKVCPSVSQLRAPAQKDVPCPVIDCKKICKQPSALRFHLERVHKIFRKRQKWELDTEKGTVQWHCPETGCVYAMNQNRFFTSRTLLKQHYGKVHLEKTLRCGECGKMFGLEKDRKRHMNNCTTVYTCTCGSIYMHRESYLMHCSRQKHPVKEEYKTKKDTANKTENEEKQSSLQREKPAVSASKLGSQSQSTNKPTSENTQKPKDKFKPILPNPNILILVNVITDKGTNKAPSPNSSDVPSQLIYIADARTSAPTDLKTMKSGRVSQGSQTKSLCVSKNGNSQTEKSVAAKFEEKTQQEDLWHIMSKQNLQHSVNRTSEGKSSKRRALKSSACTQTSSTKQKRIAAETQTTGDLILRQAMQSADIPTQRQSTASQVSPQAKVKRSHETHSVQSIETQTSVLPLRPRPKRSANRSVSMGTNTSLTVGSEVPNVMLPIPNSWSASSIHTETGTLLNGFQGPLVTETAATQTLESFHSSNVIMPPANEPSLVSQPSLPMRIHSLVDTMDQAVLCDLDLVTDFRAPPELTNAATSPRIALGSGQALSVSCGTDFSFDVANPTDYATDSMTQNLSDVQFGQNSSALELNGMFKDNVMRDQQSTKQDFENVSVGNYTEKLYSSSEGMCSQADVVNSLQEPLLSRDSLLSSSDINLTGESSIASCPQSNTEVQTNLSGLSFPELLTSGVQTSDFDPCYMNITTQTANDDMFDQFLNSMETQTNDDFFADFGFSNTETQTHLSMMTVGDEVVATAELNTESGQTELLTSPPTSHQVAGSSVGIQTIFSSRQMSPLMLDIPDQLTTTDSIGIQTQNFTSGVRQINSFSVGIQTQQNTNLSASLMDTETQTLCTNMELCPDLSESYTQTAFDDLVSFVDKLSEM